MRRRAVELRHKPLEHRGAGAGVRLTAAAEELCAQRVARCARRAAPSSLRSAVSVRHSSPRGGARARSWPVRSSRTEYTLGASGIGGSARCAALCVDGTGAALCWHRTAISCESERPPPGAKIASAASGSSSCASPPSPARSSSTSTTEPASLGRHRPTGGSSSRSIRRLSGCGLVLDSSSSRFAASWQSAAMMPERWSVRSSARERRARPSGELHSDMASLISWQSLPY
eukprot:2965193-Prymnesium_polylepis.2